MAYTAPSGERFSIAARLPFFYGWVILGISALSLFMSAPGQTYTISVFIEPMLDELGWSRTMFSGIFTAGSLTGGLAMIIVGRLFDRYGARILLTATVIAFGSAGLLMSQVDNQAELFIGLASLRMLGNGAIALITTTLIAIWFVEKRGKAMAVGMLGSAAALALFPSIIHRLIDSVGWRNSWVTLGLSIWIILLPLALILVKHSPESIGQLPDGVKLRSPGTEPGKIKRVLEEASFTLRQAMRERVFWFLLIMQSALPILGTATMFHHVSIMESMGISTEIAVSVFIVTGPANMAGSLTAGFLADRIQNRYILAVGQVLLATSLIWLLNISASWQALVYGGLLGFTIGLNMNTYNVVWANYFGRQSLGSIRGVTRANITIASAFGPLPFGYFFDMTGTYTQVILLSIVIPSICFVFALFAKPPRKPLSIR
jgi:MFS family permease